MPSVDSQAHDPPTATSELAPGLGLRATIDLQDHLMAAIHDLERLQRLLSDASVSLMGHFHGASQHLDRALRVAAAEPTLDTGALHDARQNLSGAVTSLQFQDMSAQLIVHTHQRLRSCADRLALEAMGDDPDGAAFIVEPPSRPNPVTQYEMGAGSVELF